MIRFVERHDKARMAQLDKTSRPRIRSTIETIRSRYPHQPAPLGLPKSFPKVNTLRVAGPTSTDIIDPSGTSNIIAMLHSLAHELIDIQMQHQGAPCSSDDILAIFTALCNAHPGLRRLVWDWPVSAAADSNAAFVALPSGLESLRMLITMAEPSVFQPQLPAGLKAMAIWGDVDSEGLASLHGALAAAGDAHVLVGDGIMSLAGLSSSPGLEDIVIEGAIIADTDAISSLHQLESLVLKGCISTEHNADVEAWVFRPSLMAPSLSPLLRKDQLHTLHLFDFDLIDTAGWTTLASLYQLRSLVVRRLDIETDKALEGVESLKTHGSFSLKHRGPPEGFLEQQFPAATAAGAVARLLPALEYISTQGGMPGLGSALAGHGALKTVSSCTSGSWQHPYLLAYLSSCSRLETVKVQCSGGLSSDEICTGLIALGARRSGRSLVKMEVQLPSGEGLDLAAVQRLLSSSIEDQLFSFYRSNIMPVVLLQPAAMEAMQKLPVFWRQSPSPEHPITEAQAHAYLRGLARSRSLGLPDYALTDAPLWALLAAAPDLTHVRLHSITLPGGAVPAPRIRILQLEAGSLKPVAGPSGAGAGPMTGGLLEGLQQLRCGFDSLDEMCAALAALPHLESAEITLTAAAAGHCSFTGLCLDQLKALTLGCSRDDQPTAALAAVASSSLSFLKVCNSSTSSIDADSISRSTSSQPRFFFDIRQAMSSVSRSTSSGAASAAQSPYPPPNQHLDDVIRAAASSFPQIDHMEVDLGEGKGCSMEAVTHLLQAKPLGTFRRLQLRVAGLHPDLTAYQEAQQAARPQHSTRVDLVHLHHLQTMGGTLTGHELQLLAHLAGLWTLWAQDIDADVPTGFTLPITTLSISGKISIRLPAEVAPRSSEPSQRSVLGSIVNTASRALLAAGQAKAGSTAAAGSSSRAQQGVLAKVLPQLANVRYNPRCLATAMALLHGHPSVRVLRLEQPWFAVLQRWEAGARLFSSLPRLFRVELWGLRLLGGADELLADLAGCSMLKFLTIQQVDQGGHVRAAQWLRGSSSSSSRFSGAGLRALATGPTGRMLGSLKIDTGGVYDLSSEDLAVLLDTSKSNGVAGVLAVSLPGRL